MAALACCCSLWAPGLAQAEIVNFLAVGHEQTFTVPAGVTSVQVLAVGGSGGRGQSGGAGGFGALASADLSVAPGQTLYVEVGGNGSEGRSFATAPGGFNGGGDGETGGGAGGGASDVRAVSRAVGTSPATRLIVAGGGGGGGASIPSPPYTDYGGSGGAEATGGTGYSGGGHPGSATAGGAGSSGCEAGKAGSLGTGGAGADNTCEPGGGGGGGGGGLYGGGGGASSSAGDGGGGGSSGFGPGASNTSLSTDGSGSPAISIIYNAPPAALAPAPTKPLTTVPPPSHGCVVPKLTGRKLKAVHKALTKADCKLGKAKSGKDGGSKVIAQHPRPGKELPAGSKVSVTLGATAKS